MNGCLPTVEARGLPRCSKPNSPDFKGTISHNKDSVRPAGWSSKKQKRNAALRHTQKVRGDLPPLSSEQPPQIQPPRTARARSESDCRVPARSSPSRTGRTRLLALRDSL